MKLTEKQAERLGVKARSQWSPYLEKCCLLVSANSSYERSAEDLRVLTGIAVSSSTQQRLVHRQQFELPAVSKLVEEMSLDGGKVRLRTAVGKSSEWRDYKGINLDGQVVSAFYRENERLSEWVNQQPLAIPVSCLGDGHDGIWNIYGEIANEAGRREILDWYHLVENLGKVSGSQRRLDEVESLLWKGDIEGAIAQFQGCQEEGVKRFIGYLNKHRKRIVNYGYFQAEGLTIGSGAIESTVKQIGRRLKISGAQWKEENVPQVLMQRCAYLNGAFSS